MPIKTNCLCGKRLTVNDSVAGKRIKCPACGAPVEIPKASVLDRKRESAEVESPTNKPKPPQKGPPIDGKVPEAYEHSLLLLQGHSFLQIVMEPEKVIDVDSIERLRTLLLDGVITRFHLARWVEPKPDRDEIEGHDERVADAIYRRNLLDWKRRRIWRPIGEGLAQEEDAIRLLYDPVGLYLDKASCAVMIFCWFVITAVVAVVCFWGNVIANTLAKLVVFGFACFLNVFIGCGLGSVLGKYVGASYAKSKAESLPMPPDDGYRTKN